MGKKFKIDFTIYKSMLNYLNNLHFLEKKGDNQDMNFLQDDHWLRDTAVVYHVNRYKGMWEIKLLFAHYNDPLKLVLRKISKNTDRKKAEKYAQYMMRLAAKDQRGTLKINTDGIKICVN